MSQDGVYFLITPKNKDNFCIRCICINIFRVLVTCVQVFLESFYYNYQNGFGYLKYNTRQVLMGMIRL